MTTEASAPPTARRRPTLTGGLGLAIVGFWLLMAVFGPAVAPVDAGRIVGMPLGPMTVEHPLGTDYLGRDMLARILWGARYTVGIALAATCIAWIAGISLGLTAAVVGGVLDSVVSRVLDAFISIPNKIFALVIVAVLAPSIPVLIATIAVIYTPGCYRIARALAVNINTMDYIAVARARGEGIGYIMREEVLPNMTLPMTADFGLRFVFVVLLLSSLSFLGMGVQPPDADWGSLVRENIEGVAYGSPAVIMPAVAIATLTIGVNMLIDNLPSRVGRQADA